MNSNQTIPRPLVRTNQWVIVISVGTFMLTGISAVLLIPLLSGLSALFLNVHPVMEIAKRFLQKPFSKYVQEDKEQQRFNQILAVSMLSLAFVSSLLNFTWLSLFFSVMVLLRSSLLNLVKYI
jgi:hypothetical protein